ncbi:MAG TPA: exodeoxyribonuclease III [Pseudothauera hydrothermalis]|uniref:exodeoxyribonuclease III n=1 Tax=Pseudothauera hydrothermalis TaxID=2184083 RepID=UPI000E099845|nr:exodeoxyribonuclease III [Pseudothauera hydrothermalis]HNQ75489.1 exodeoxyribonuclease III [Pseudothauera hydrothermalis]
MKIATWNVNSLKIRLPQVLDWLVEHRPDALCLQELKLEDKAFPHEALAAVGYRAVTNGQKTYNGVAILTPTPAAEVSRDIPGFADPQKRIIAATIDGVRLICGYFPNGQAVGSEKFDYKLRWLAALTDWVREEMVRHPKLILAGDFNIAPEARDAHPDWKDEIHVSEPERAAFRALLALGLVDAFRLFDQPERSYSWWDYRMLAFRRNFGLRIDHILVSEPLRAACRGCTVDKAPRRLERPSDHAPVVLELEV